MGISNKRLYLESISGKYLILFTLIQANTVTICTQYLLTGTGLFYSTPQTSWCPGSVAATTTIAQPAAKSEDTIIVMTEWTLAASFAYHLPTVEAILGLIWCDLLQLRVTICTSGYISIENGLAFHAGQLLSVRGAIITGS